MSENSNDTWSDFQAFKLRQNKLREKLLSRKREREGLVLGLVSPPQASGVSGDHLLNKFSNKLNDDKIDKSTGQQDKQSKQRIEKHDDDQLNILINYDETIEITLLQCLCDIALQMPINSRALCTSVKQKINKGTYSYINHDLVQSLLEKFALQGLINIKNDTFTSEGETCVIVVSVDHAKLLTFINEFNSRIAVNENDNELCLSNESDNEKNNTILDKISDRSSSPSSVKSPSSSTTFDNTSNKKRTSESSGQEIVGDRRKWLRSTGSSNESRKSKSQDSESQKNIEDLLSLQSTRERETKRFGEELLELLSKPTAMERSLVERFRSVGGVQVQEFCTHGTKDDCKRMNSTSESCSRLHFRKIIQKHTDETLGDCSFLNTCFHTDTCKYVHYEVDQSSIKDRRKIFENEKKFIQQVNSIEYNLTSDSNHNKQQQKQQQQQTKLHTTIYNTNRFKSILYPPQWIQCDLRYFDMSILGKFSVVMADPPWDIHMELPYGTMSDDEMRQLNVPCLQDEGLIFLWVTGRAMELGRECLKLWGYERCDEIIWVKTNQLQRIIRTGRTGHWLNHGKEHCLVGIKGSPKEINRGLDCDVIVAEVRATSHKPDEIYGIIERLSPGTRKIELFGRTHNVQPNWITLGNQVDRYCIKDPQLLSAFKARYPNGLTKVPY